MQYWFYWILIVIIVLIYYLPIGNKIEKFIDDEIKKYVNINGLFITADTLKEDQKNDDDKKNTTENVLFSEVDFGGKSQKLNDNEVVLIKLDGKVVWKSIKIIPFSKIHLEKKIHEGESEERLIEIINDITDVETFLDMRKFNDTSDVCFKIVVE